MKRFDFLFLMESFIFVYFSQFFHVMLNFNIKLHNNKMMQITNKQQYKFISQKQSCLLQDGPRHAKQKLGSGRSLKMAPSQGRMWQNRYMMITLTFSVGISMQLFINISMTLERKSVSNSGVSFSFVQWALPFPLSSISNVFRFFWIVEIY